MACLNYSKSYAWVLKLFIQLLLEKIMYSKIENRLVCVWRFSNKTNISTAYLIYLIIAITLNATI